MKHRMTLAIILIICFLLNLTPIGFVGFQAEAATKYPEYAAAHATDIVTEVPDGYVPISDIFDLYFIRNDLSSNYILMADLDLSEALTEGGDLYNTEGWIALGYSAEVDSRIQFTGTFDGNGHKISGLSCDGLGAGLFWRIGEGGTVKNLTIASGSVSGNNIMGSIAQGNYGTIDNCHNYTNINYTTDQSISVSLGGIVGSNNETGIIRNCSNYGSITALATYNTSSAAAAGGIVGNNLGKIDKVWNRGSITVESAYYFNSIPSYGTMAGGIVGRTYAIIDAYPAKLSNAYNTGAVTAKNTYNSSSAFAHAGGIYGFYETNNATQNITCCYNIGEITATTRYSGINYAGGTCGYANSSVNRITYCYYLNNIEKGIGNNSSNSCVSLTEALMKKQQSFAGFDFSETWSMGTGDYLFPVLKLSHTHEMTHIDAVDPTCYADGNIEYWYCSKCGLYFADADGNQEITLEDTVVPGGHIYDGGTVIPPTCTDQGYTKYTCARCGDSYQENFTAPLGHAWNEGIVIQEATETESGILRFTCTRCGQTRDEIIPPTGHEHSYTPVVTPPTCTEQGYTTYTCSCGDSYVDDYVPALGHDFGPWTQTNTPTCTEEGMLIRICSRCGEAETSTVNALGHDWNDPVYSWTDDFGFATAIRVCNRNPSHVETETVITTSQIIKEATYQEEGEIRYTATFANGAFETQTKTVVIPKLERVNPFVDVEKGKYYYTPVLWAYYHDPQITGGTDATHFSPKNTCTREQIVTFLWKAAGAPNPETTESPFSDVTPGKYYFKPIMWAVENGITGGVGDGKFGVKQGCTREQCVTFLWKAAGAPAPETTDNPFSDVKPGKYYFKAIMWAVENGITGGVGGGKFGVGQTCTRGQIVTFLYKYMVG